MTFILEHEVGQPENVVTAADTPYALRKGWTLERVKAEAARSEFGPPLLCRIKHRRRVIADLFVPEDPLLGMLAILRRTSALVHCSRCGLIAERSDR